MLPFFETVWCRCKPFCLGSQVLYERGCSQDCGVSYKYILKLWLGPGVFRVWRVELWRCKFRPMIAWRKNIAGNGGVLASVPVGAD